MKLSRSWVRGSTLFVAVMALISSTARSQSYGGHDQVLTIGVSSFKGVQGATAAVGVDGYLYNPAAGTFSYYLAPLPLPEGALIESLCAYVNDSDPGAFEYVQAYLVAFKLVPAGDPSGPVELAIPGASADSSAGGDIGYGYYCTNPFNYTLRSKIDIDSDGTTDNVVYYMAAYIPSPSQNSVRLGGVRVTWKRQVSPPPATPTFDDVPGSDLAFAHIEALVASGITSGCSAPPAPPLYCPDAPLTRRQMAVFLAKALGLHWVD